MLRKAQILAISVIVISFGIVLSIEAQQDYNIPQWIKNNALWWGKGEISDADFISGINYLIENNVLRVPQSSVTDKEYDDFKRYSDNQITQLMLENDAWKKEYEALNLEKKNLERRVSDLQSSLLTLSRQGYDLESALEDALKSVEERKATTTIQDQTIYWNFYDSKGNQYSWSLPVESYENLVADAGYYDLLRFELPNGNIVEVGDMSAFVTRGFTKVIDDVYDNAVDEEDFVYEVWHITSQLTTYSYDIGEYPRYALETLSRGGGDCEDTAILIADMLISSSHTRNWDIQFVYFDSDYPENPRTVNHVAVSVDTGKHSYVIESTAKTLNEMNAWAGVDIFGWWYDV